MGYRDALIGGLLATAALRGRDTRGWFLASGGADAADLLGGMSVHHDMKRSNGSLASAARSSVSASGSGAGAPKPAGRRDPAKLRQSRRQCPLARNLLGQRLEP